MKRNTVTACFIFMMTILTINAFGQITVSGTVRSAGAGQPVPFAAVGIKNSNQGVLTDENGKYELKLGHAGSYVLTTRIIGFQERNDTLDVQASMIFDPMITESGRSLEEVVVNSTRV